MNAAVNRRAFVGSVAAGLPVLAGAAYGLAVAPPARAHEHAAPGAAPDPMFEHVVHELAVIHNRGTERGFTGEDARAIAAQLRTAAVRGAQIDIDATANEGVQQLIRRRGRDAVLTIDINKTAVRAQMKQYGIEIDDRWPASRTVDQATRMKALDAVISGGVTGVLSHTAHVFEQIGSAVDRRRGSVARVSHVQSDPEMWSLCSQLLGEIGMLLGQAGPICEASAIVQGLDIVCTAIMQALWVYWVVYLSYCG
jgi:hypothetical protein